MIEDDFIISENLWLIYLNNNKSYQGYVYHNDGKISYVLPQVTISNCPINLYGNLTEYSPIIDTSYISSDVTSLFENSDILYNSDFWKLGANRFGQILNFLGDNNISTRAKPKGATPGTSIASEYFREKSFLKDKKTPKLLFKILPKKINAGPFGKSPLRSNSLAAVAGRSVPIVGRGLIGVGFAISGYTIYTSDNKTKAILRETGGWTGAWAGAELGASIGASIGAFFGGVGAAPGAMVGGILGSVLGFWSGSTIVEVTYDTIENN